MKLGAKSTSTSFLDSGTSIVGDLQFSGELRIDGEFHGSIKSSDNLIVGKSAEVQADISAGHVQIFGSVSGDIECARRVEICAEGHLQGNVRTHELVIQEGAKFEGLSRPATESTLIERTTSHTGSDTGDTEVAPSHTHLSSSAPERVFVADENQ